MTQNAARKGATCSLRMERSRIIGTKINRYILPRMRLATLRVSIALLALSSGLAHGWIWSKDEPVSITEKCRLRLESARADIAKNKPSAARGTIDEMLSDCSGTGFLEEAQFLMAETYFLEKEWTEARGEFLVKNCCFGICG